MAVNDAFILGLIDQRMKARCINEFLLEPVQVKVMQNETVELAAQNELWVLASIWTLEADDVPAKVYIESDDNTQRWQNNATFKTPQFAVHQAFTGQIFITSTEDNSYLEFIRVIPRYNPCNTCGLHGCGCNKSMP